MRIFRNLSELPRFKNAVLTIGSFDGVHTGHQKIIEQLRQIAREKEGESVLITFYPHPRLVLAPNSGNMRLLNTIEEKVALLEKYGIDNVVIVPFTKEFHLQSPEDYIRHFLIEKFHPAALVIGYDHRFGHNREGDIDYLRRFAPEGNFEIIEIKKQEVADIAVSSTKIRKSLEQGDVKTAAQFLNHHFTLSGTVAHGQKIGKQLGFPTANIVPQDSYKLIPPTGIYAVYAWHKQQRYGAMLYIGNRPTLKEYDNLTIEAHIFDFDQEIYGDVLKIEFLDHIREDRSFDDLEALRLQLAEDEKAARLILNLEKKKPVTQSNQTLAAVVILNFNGPDHLRTFLPSVLNHQTSRSNIYVADNGSTDDSVLVLEKEFPQVKLIRLPQNLGFAAGYNAALKDLEETYLVLLNSDVAVSANWLDPILEKMEQQPDIGVGQPKILAYRQPGYFEYAGAAGGWLDTLAYPFCRGRIFDTVEKDEGQYDQSEEIFWASGCAMVIRRELYQQLGGLDGDYFAHMEEIDLCWRVKRAGYQVVVFPQSVVHHLGGGTLDYDNPRKAFLNFRNSLYTLFKNEEKSALFWKIGFRLLLDGVAGFRFLMQGKAGHLWAIIQAHWAFFFQIGRLRQKRQTDQMLIDQCRIGSPNVESGRYIGSILKAYFIRGKKTFRDLD